MPETTWGNTKKNIQKQKVHCQTLNIIRGSLNPQKWIPGKILILLDPYNLSVGQKLPILFFQKLVNGNGNWQLPYMQIAIAIFGQF